MLDDDDLTFYAPRNQNYLACNFFFPFVLIVSNVSLGLFCVTTKFLTLKDLLKSISYLVSLADVSYIKNDEEDGLAMPKKCQTYKVPGQPDS